MMDTIYSLMDAVLPFVWLGSNFMKNAFLAVLLVTPLFGLISTMVVSNRMAFFSDSLGHGAFTGIAIGVLLGSVSPLLSLVVFSVVFALFITYIKNKSTASTDTIIGVFSATAIALGLMIMSHGGGFNKFSSFLIGDILSITPDDLSALAVVFVLGLVAWGLLFNQLLVLSINSSFARSRGIPAFWIESAFASLLAVVVSISIQWVGILIINAMLVLPAARAQYRQQRQAVPSLLGAHRDVLGIPRPDARLLLRHGRRCDDCRDFLGAVLPDAPVEAVLQPLKVDLIGPLGADRERNLW